MTQLGVVMDPLETIHLKKDSTLAMLIEAQARSWPIYFMEQKDLFIRDGIAFGNMSPLKINIDASPWFIRNEAITRHLAELDVILMRKDPPFDMEYIYSTYILEMAEKEKVLVINKPQSLRDANEKFYATLFPECCPPHLVTRNIEQLKAFCLEHQEVVFKPLDSMGGRSIFLIRQGDMNINVILETLTSFGSKYIMAQKFIPAITQGDKRILLIDGEPIPYALARIPKQGDIRGNLAAGGSGKAIPINDRDYWICKQIAQTLKNHGLIFVGIDVIGEYLTEINVTSPTCIREIDAAFHTHISAKLLDCITEKLDQGL